MKIGKLLLSLIVFVWTLNLAQAQNIVGYKIQIAADAPAFIELPSEVDNARWDNNEMNNFYKFFTPNANVLQISYNGTPNPPKSGNGFSISQGKNTHIFYLEFIDKYDINKDPTLFYNFSDKSKLKAAAELAKKQKAITAGNDIAQNEEALRKQKKEERAALVLKQKEDEEKKAAMLLAQKKHKAEVEAESKAAAEKAKIEEANRQTEIAKAKKEAERIAAEEKKAKAQEEAIAKANAEADLKKKQEQEKKRKEQETEEKRLAAERKKQEEKDKLAAEQAKQEAELEKLAKEKAAREEAEKKRLADKAEKERKEIELAQKAAEERERKAEVARKDAEAKQKAKEEAEAKLIALRAEQERQKAEKEYTQVGLWNRYGSKGINLYEIPIEQFAYNNADFYIAEDTLINANYSEQVLKQQDRININSETKAGITFSLKSISFDGPYAYYKLEVDNQSKEDYLVGANILAWYNSDGSPKVYLKCSYLTHISFFPLVKPAEKKQFVYVTRAANINNDDRLVFSVQERRPTKPKFDVLFAGSDYLNEFSRVAKQITVSEKDNGKKQSEETKAPKQNKKKNKKEE